MGCQWLFSHYLGDRNVQRSRMPVRFAILAPFAIITPRIGRRIFVTIGVPSILAIPQLFAELLAGRGGYSGYRGMSDTTAHDAIYPTIFWQG